MPTGKLSKPAKVDIVCQGGKKWVRLSTIKPLSLLSEFRNAESYVVDDDDDDDDSSSGDGGSGEEEVVPKLSLELINAQLAKGEVDGIASQCSIMKMARELQKAADLAQTKCSWGRPKIEVALTRLDLDDLTSTLEGKFYDKSEKVRFEARIRAMLVEMENMQIVPLMKYERQLYDDEDKRRYLPSSVASGEVTLNDRITSLPQLPVPPIAKSSTPTTTLNLDLSALVAFVSQISHMQLSNLPDPEDVDKCFKKDHWKMESLAKAGGDLDEEDQQTTVTTSDGPSEVEKNAHTQHARALSDQLRREMTTDSFFDAILNGLPDGQQLKLVCTSEAAEKFTEILSLVGGPTEQRRARNILEESGQEDFWRGSRWEKNSEIRKRIILPVRPVPFTSSEVSPLSSSSDNEFVKLARKSVQEGLKDLLGSGATTNNSNVGTGVQRQTPHTLASLLYGLVNGRSTLTTNIASIKWLIRDVNRYEVAEASTQGHIENSYLAPFASAVLFYPRSLAEKMMTSTYLTPLHCDLKTPLDWSGDTARDDVRLVPYTPTTSDSYKDPLKSSQFESFEDKAPITESERDIVHGTNLHSGREKRMVRGFRATKRWFRGPRPRSTLLIRHFWWWPLQPLEESWLKLTSPLAWKDPDLTQRACPQDEERQQSHLGATLSEGMRMDQKESSAYRDWKLNRLHWIALALTFIAWAFGFTFLVKDLWYEANVLGSDGSTNSPSFFDCTTTFWTANSNCGLNGNLCSPFTSSTSIPFRCPASCEMTTLGGRRAVGDQLPSYVTLVVGGGPRGNSSSVEPQESTGPFIYRGDSFICSAAIHAGVISSERGGCSSIWLNGAYSGYQGLERNGIQSTSFNSSFPVSYYFDSNVKGEKCTDRSDRGYILNVILLAWHGFVLQPKRIVYL